MIDIDATMGNRPILADKRTFSTCEYCCGKGKRHYIEDRDIIEGFKGIPKRICNNCFGSGRKSDLEIDHDYSKAKMLTETRQKNYDNHKENLKSIVDKLNDSELNTIISVSLVRKES